MECSSELTKAGLQERSFDLDWQGTEERGRAAGLDPALPLPECCQTAQPVMKSRDQE